MNGRCSTADRAARAREVIAEAQAALNADDWRRVGMAADALGMLALDETDPDVIEGTTSPEALDA